MKKNIILIAFIVTTSSFAQGWINSIENAKKIAIVSDKLIFVDFTASWCGPCKKMESDVWNKKDTQQLMNNFVNVKIDIDNNKDVARKYGVNSIPNLFVLDGNGKVIENIRGYKDKTFINNLLDKYSVNTAFLQKNLVNVYKKATYSSTLRLASKYQIFSIYLDDKIKGNFLSLANKYFEESYKLIKKSKVNNKKMLIQKIDLLKLRRKSFQNNPNKVLKKLKKYKATSIEASNNSLFAFLHYVSFKQLQQEEDALKWFSSLSEKDKKLAELILK